MMIGVKKASDFEKSLRDAKKELEVLVGLVNQIYNLNLALPQDLSGLPALKKFCGDLLERAPHPWDAPLRDLKPTVRFSIGASLFLFRKRLPSAPSLDPVKKFLDLVTEPAPDPDPEFISFCQRKIGKIFRQGWDRRYRRKVASATISTSATTDSNRASGGARADPNRVSQLVFSNQCLGLESIPAPGPVKVAEVPDGGKIRVVTIGGVERAVLKPLHGLMYDHLSQFDWLLRGDAKPKSFKDFTLQPEEVFVSGDYESATDNLSLEMYEVLLKSVLDRCDYVPDSIKDFAIKSARSTLIYKGREYIQRRGQLMGNLLSFPFLCLTNYLAFKYSVRRKVPLKINGDDIIFRGTQAECDGWKEMVGKCGLTLSKGKTLVDSRFFSLNSTFFRALGKRVRLIPFIRSKALFKAPDSVDAFTSQFREMCPGFGAAPRDLVRLVFLSRNSRLLWRTERSMTRGLGVRVSHQLLRRAHLWDRERFYLRLDSEPPLPPAPTQIFWDSVPLGWHKENIRSTSVHGGYSKSLCRRIRRSEREVYGEIIRLAWESRAVSTKVDWCGYWASLKTFRYVGFNLRKLARLLRLSTLQIGFWRASFSDPFESDPVPVPAEMRWVKNPEEEEGGVSLKAKRTVSPVLFVLGD
jgi:hypothetical protein